MKLAIIAAANSPHTVKWANAFAKKGDKVTIFSLPEDKMEESTLDTEVSINYLGLSEVKGGLKKNVAELKRFLQAGDFDVVNAIGGLTYGFMAARARPQSLLLTILGPDITAACSGGPKGIMLKSIKSAGAIVCPSAVCMQKVRSIFKKNKEIFIVPPGVDIYEFDKKDVQKEEGVFTYGCVKALEYVSGIDMLIDAFAKVKEKYEGKTQLKIYGKGTMESSLKQKCKDAGLADSVRFMGFVPNKKMPEEINKMDVLCNMSINEVFGVSTIEAMACKVNVVATDTEGSSEIILNGVTGFTVKVRNVDAFAERMLECAENKELNEKMGAKARGDVVDLYEINMCIEKYSKALTFVQNN